MPASILTFSFIASCQPCTHKPIEDSSCILSIYLRHFHPWSGPHIHCFCHRPKVGKLEPFYCYPICVHFLLKQQASVLPGSACHIWMDLTLFFQSNEGLFKLPGVELASLLVVSWVIRIEQQLSCLLDVGCNFVVFFLGFQPSQSSTVTLCKWSPSRLGNIFEAVFACRNDVNISTGTTFLASCEPNETFAIS